MSRGHSTVRRDESTWTIPRTEARVDRNATAENPNGVLLYHRERENMPTAYGLTVPEHH